MSAPAAVRGGLSWALMSSYVKISRGVAPSQHAGWAIPDGVRPPALSLRRWHDASIDPVLMVTVRVTALASAGQATPFSCAAPHDRQAPAAASGGWLIAHTGLRLLHVSSLDWLAAVFALSRWASRRRSVPA